MRKETGKAWGENIVRVSKKAAKKAYENGYEVYMYPCKVNINSPWYSMPWFIDKKTSAFEFERMVNNFEYYNCQYNAEGKYAKFFIKA